MPFFVSRCMIFAIQMISKDWEDAIRGDSFLLGNWQKIRQSPSCRSLKMCFLVGFQLNFCITTHKFFILIPFFRTTRRRCILFRQSSYKKTLPASIRRQKTRQAS
jgi:hypothetical protein